LPNGGLLGEGSLDRNPPRGPPLDPPIGFYGWPTLDPRIFMPPWYQLVPIRSKLISKLPYQKFQYPTYVKDIDPDVHIRVFKKVIKTNGEIVEIDIIKLFGFTLQDNISK
jgi:hypothetical protein